MRSGTTLAIACWLAGVLALASAPRALAQERCPDPEIELAPEDQAVCWYGEHASGAAACEDGACAREASRWCERAALDDPSTASACLLAHVAARRWDAAYGIVRSLPPELTPDAARCRGALTSPLATRIATSPAGAEISVDARPVGVAPVEVTLTHPFVEHRIVARFGDDERTLSPEELSDAFDGASCTLGLLSIVGPAAPAGAAIAADVGAAPRAPGRDETLTVLGGVALGTGAAGLVAGISLVAWAESLAVGLAGASDGEFWTPGHASDLSNVEIARPAGWAAIVGGAVIAGIGLTLVIVDRGAQAGTERPVARLELAPAGTGLAIRGSFE